MNNFHNSSEDIWLISELLVTFSASFDVIKEKEYSSFQDKKNNARRALENKGLKRSKQPLAYNVEKIPTSNNILADWLRL